MWNPAHLDALITRIISSCQKSNPNSYVIQAIPSLYSEWNIQHLGLMDLWSFIPRHQRLIQYVSILNLTITNKVHQYIRMVQSPITITKCSNWTEFALEWHTALSGFIKDFSLPFWLLTFSNSNIAITFANTSNRCFLDLPGDSLWYGHCICHVMPVHWESVLWSAVGASDHLLVHLGSHPTHHTSQFKYNNVSISTLLTVWQ